MQFLLVALRSIAAVRQQRQQLQQQAARTKANNGLLVALKQTRPLTGRGRGKRGATYGTARVQVLSVCVCNLYVWHRLLLSFNLALGLRRHWPLPSPTAPAPGHIHVHVPSPATAPAAFGVDLSLKCGRF